jgi:hypothetical protein
MLVFKPLFLKCAVQLSSLPIDIAPTKNELLDFQNVLQTYAGGEYPPSHHRRPGDNPT